jgi:large subunit ribosomal protein L31
MKKAIHPKIYTDTKVTCVCGNTFVTTSTVPVIQVDICSACHPLFTGTQKFIDAEGRIEKFNKKMKQTEERKATKEAANKAKAAKAVAPEKATKKVSLKELLKEMNAEEAKPAEPEKQPEQTETKEETKQ